MQSACAWRSPLLTPPSVRSVASAVQEAKKKWLHHRLKVLRKVGGRGRAPLTQQYGATVCWPSRTQVSRPAHLKQRGSKQVLKKAKVFEVRKIQRRIAQANDAAAKGPSGQS